MSQRIIYANLILLLCISLVWPVLSQEVTPPVDLSQTATLTPSPTMTATLSPTQAELTAELTEELIPSASPTLLPTIEIIAPVETLLPEISPIAEITSLPELTIEAEITIAPEISPEVTEVIQRDIPQVVIRGSLEYQNRLSHEGISVSIFTIDGILVSTSQTNAAGIFSVPAPSQEGFFLLAEAPLHRPTRFWFDVTTSIIPSIVLAGGDLNKDACINQLDLDILLVSYELENSLQTDINLDGITDLADLAILTGNYDPACTTELLPEATVEALSN